MTWQFCSVCLSCSVVNGWWLAFMQLIRGKWLEKKPALRPAAIFGLCDERNTGSATMPALHPSQAGGWREAGASRATVVFPRSPRACKSHRFSVIRNTRVLEPLVLPPYAGVPALWRQIAHLGLEVLNPSSDSPQCSQHHPVEPAQPSPCCAGEASPHPQP